MSDIQSMQACEPKLIMYRTSKGLKLSVLESDNKQYVKYKDETGNTKRIYVTPGWELIHKGVTKCQDNVYDLDTESCHKVTTNEIGISVRAFFLVFRLIKEQEFVDLIVFRQDDFRYAYLTCEPNAMYLKMPKEEWDKASQDDRQMILAEQVSICKNPIKEISELNKEIKALKDRISYINDIVKNVASVSK